MQLVEKNCGIHYGPTGGQCSKCGYFRSDGYAERQQKGIQYNGVLWIEVLGEQKRQTPDVFATGRTTDTGRD